MENHAQCPEFRWLGSDSPSVRPSLQKKESLDPCGTDHLEPVSCPHPLLAHILTGEGTHKLAGLLGAAGAWDVHEIGHD